MGAMRKLPSNLGALFFVLLCCSACVASFVPSAASANGVSISENELTSALRAIGDNKTLSCAISGNGAIALRGAGGRHTYASGVAASLLTTLIDDVVLRAQERAEHLAPTAFSNSIARTQVESSFGPANGANCAGEGSSVLAELPGRFASVFVSYAEARAALDAHLAGVALSPAGLSSYAAAHRSATELLCVSAIESRTRQAIVAIQKAAQAGASFAALARAHSTDVTSAANGGSLGCVLAAQFTAPLSGVVTSLATGVVSAPVSFNGSYLLLLVTSHHVAANAVVASVIEQNEDSVLNFKVASLFRHARVEVNPAYGTWSKVMGNWQVVAPSSSAHDYAVNLDALSPKK